MTQMTPKQALDLLAQATGLLQLKRDGHQAVIQAIQVLDGILPKEEKEVKEEKEKKK